MKAAAPKETWTSRSTGDLIAEGKLSIGDGYRAKNSELSTSGLPFARAGNIDGGFHFENADRFPEADLLKVGDKVSQPGDVVFTSKGTVGRFAFVRPTTPRFVYSPQLCFWRTQDPETIDPRWLYYWMLGGEFTHQMSGVKGQTDMADYVSLTDQRRMEITLPPAPLQRAIAGVLGALDDKIEQNRRAARALERLARAIFRAWFVDFEPVKAKAAGTTAFPSMPQPVFDALPTRFVDSAIGPVPEGWEVRAIGDVVTAKGGGTPSTKNQEYWDGGDHCWATPKDMSRLAHPVLLDTERRITDSGVNSISSGILPVGTVLMSSRAPVGYLAIAGVPTAINQGFIAMVCDGPLPPTYVLNWAFASLDAIKAHASGTTFPEISKKNFRPLPVVVPTSDVIVAYREAADPLFNLLTACVKENEQLATMRDYLLPKLLSGQVRVEAAHG
jgi:type I restriction enzyme S subunit